MVLALLVVCVVGVAAMFAFTRLFYKNRFEERIVELKCEVAQLQGELELEREVTYKAEMSLGFLEIEKERLQRERDAHFEGQLPKPPRCQSELENSDQQGDFESQESRRDNEPRLEDKYLTDDDMAIEEAWDQHEIELRRQCGL